MKKVDLRLTGLVHGWYAKLAKESGVPIEHVILVVLALSIRNQKPKPEGK